MANILKQIKVGNTTYNIEPYTSYLPLSDLGNATFKVTRGASQSTKNTGYWAGMLHSTQGGSPVLPSNGKWWHVISMDWTGTDTNNWISQLALPTQDGGVPYYRRNDGGGGVSIDSSTWHAFITDENIGSQNVNYANSAGSANSVAWGNVSGRPSSLPASDVYDWAKASSKPTYTKAEVGLGNVDNTADANKNVNSATSSYLLRTYSASDTSHGADYYLKCRHNVDGNERFKLQIVRSNGSVTHSTSVDYANSAGSVAWGNVSGRPETYAPSAHNHTNLKSNTDNRNTNTTPNDYNGVLNIAGLKDNSKIGLDTNTYGTYSCLLGVRGWQDSSGGDSHEIALTGNGQIMHRSGSTTSWGGWDKIAHTSYIDTYFPRAKYGNDSYYSDVSNSFIGGVYNGPRTNDWEFLYRAQHRNGAGDGSNYVMEVVSNLTSDSSIYWRKKTGGSFTSFREIIDSNNIGSQSVNYANSAGSVAWGNVTGKPSTFPPIGHGHSTATQSGDGFMSSADKKKLDGIAEGANKTVVDSKLNSSSSNPVQNSTIYSAFSGTVRFDSGKYTYGDNGSWRLQQYYATGNSLDIQYGKITINAQEKTYDVSFMGEGFASDRYAIVCGVYRSNRNSWFWSPLVTRRSATGFSVYVRGNTSGDNSGTLFYIAIKSN